MTPVDNTLEDYGPDGKEWAMTLAGYNHVDSVIHQAYHGASPVGGLVWHGHAVREAFVAGAEWQKSRQLPPEPAVRVNPLVWTDFAGIEMVKNEFANDDNLAIALCSYFESRIDCPEGDENGAELDDNGCWKVWASENAETVMMAISNKANETIDARILAAIDTAPDPRVEALVEAGEWALDILQGYVHHPNSQNDLENFKTAVAAWKGGAA